MAKYKIYADYGYAGAPEYNGIIEVETEKEANDWAYDVALERVDSWVVLVDDDAEDESDE